MLMLTQLLKRPLQKFLAGLELPGHEAVSRLADKRSRGVVAQFSEVIGELMQFREGVHRGAADLRAASLLAQAVSRQKD